MVDGGEIRADAGSFPNVGMVLVGSQRLKEHVLRFSAHLLSRLRSGPGRRPPLTKDGSSLDQLTIFLFLPLFPAHDPVLATCSTSSYKRRSIAGASAASFVNSRSSLPLRPTSDPISTHLHQAWSTFHRTTISLSPLHLACGSLSSNGWAIRTDGRLVVPGAGCLTGIQRSTRW